MREKDCVKKTLREERRQLGDIKFTYRLSSTTSRRVASFRLPLYSISVTMIEDGEESYQELKEIFADIGKAITFFDEIVDNLVTPIDLPYILEDRILT